MEEKYIFGCLPPKVDLRDFKFKATTINFSDLPESFSLEKVTKIKNQFNVGSCVAHSAATIMEYYNLGRNTLSTNFIYGIRKKLYNSSGVGMYLRDACKIMQKYGDPLEEDCKGNTEVDKVFSIAEKAFEDKDIMDRASFFRIESYTKCKTDDEIKYGVYTYGPVLACIKWYNNTKVKNGILKVNKENDFGYHAIVIIGWNKDGFICQNSWGNLWGDKGYFILPYDHGISEAYSIIDYKDENTDEIKKKTNNKIFDIIYKLLNFIINLFKGR